ncbi:transglutaminase family protein [Hydrogenimonas cancrithermarum]|uniref:Transglutaminase-like domain-containing protein n=1 Tax=Hydrogenimonas cancrithermarum TaxID=2993563 RepID=A0ABM8FPL1_9BACT|nr:DUF3488 and transglutaminase-like domain-containing protein [Hydrogenimonas cancrithermarum]BDY13945.1 hypothetical protein HCR_22570 [Hydrogenimonas cancrithermarum]
MRYWKRSQPTERPIAMTDPKALRLLDIAYLTVLPPILLVAKLPMLLFMMVVVFLVISRKSVSRPLLVFTALLGLVAIFLSLYGAFNFIGLSRLKLFVELLAYLLILAVSLQRLTRTINGYLIVSPMLLLALSLFFFDSIAMLVYIVFELFILLWLILTWQMQSGFRESLRMTGILFLLSLPWVVLLFIFFPRISFGHASYGFRGESFQRMGHDGTMRLDAGALNVLSDRIVMEVGFEGEFPPESKLYFRGSVLYVDKKDHWEPLPPFIQHRIAPRKYATPPMYEEATNIVIYKVNLYPTHKKWLYLLDLPIEAPEGAWINADFETTVKETIDAPQIYEASSALEYRYGASTDETVIAYALDANASSNPKTAAAAKKIRADYPEEERRIDALVRFFKTARLTYTLKPEPLELNHATDSFLFEKKKGYCVHFASSFVTMARLAGLPARIVTGYKGKMANRVKNYLAVEERDAHAWAEVLIDGHWQRVETTATAAFISDDTVAELLRKDTTQGDATVSRARTRLDLYILYAKYQVETWILRYSRFRQMQLLEKAKNDPIFVIQFIVALLLLIIVVTIAVRHFKRAPCPDKILCLLQPLLKRLEKEGYSRKEGETLRSLFKRYLEDHPEEEPIETIDRIYHHLRYGKNENELKELKEKIRAFLKNRIDER